MKWISRNQIVTVSLTIMAAALVVERGDAAPNSPPGPEVRVVNTTTNPVPVIQLGTTTVNLSSSNNTVVVVNPTNNPVLVRQVDSGAVQPFQVITNVESGTGDGIGETTVYTVPSGKRLVIEYISFDILVTEGQNVVKTLILTGLPAGRLTGRLIAIPYFNGNVGNNPLSQNAHFQSSQLVKSYAEAASFVSAQIIRNSTAGRLSADVTVTGYLVDVP